MHYDRSLGPSTLQNNTNLDTVELGQKAILLRRKTFNSSPRKTRSKLLEGKKERKNLLNCLTWETFPEIQIITDASCQGWGAKVDSSNWQGKWSDEVKTRLSNYKELRALWETIKVFHNLLLKKHLKVFSDNTTTVAYLKHQGATKSPGLKKLAEQIFRWAEENVVVSVTAVHLKGSENIEADYLSRKTLDPGEWSLCQEIFLKICKKWGTPQVDLFASKQNVKVDCFCSLNPRDHPWAMDTFSIKWMGDLAYAFPALALIPKVLQKISRDPVTVILVVPYWPNRIWFSILKELAMEDPWEIPYQANLLSQGPIIHKNPSLFRFSAWILRVKC